jgi:glycosyltransferase involved in cell wall biosynthesis
MAESFLEEEIDYLVSAFDQVVIVARDVRSKEVRKESSGFEAYRIDPESDISEKIVAGFLVISRARTCYSFVRDEINDVRRQGKQITPAILSTMVHDLVKAITTAHHIEKIVKTRNMRGTLFLYSYWMNSSALALTFVQNKHGNVVRFTRAHGGDVYESRSKNSYLSFRRTLIERLDRIFAISESARRHLASKTTANVNKIVVSRLGIHGRQSSINSGMGSRSHRIVSCSFLVPVKRVHLIIEALSLVKESVEWTHVGDGPLRNELELLANEKLSGKVNIQYCFTGSMTHESLMEYYEKNTFHLFINTSSSEGVPVTMMEAQSFGMPILAPDVGGIAEIVSEANGKLFSANASAAEIAANIEWMLTLPAQDVEQLRANAFRNWQSKYNAEKNFPTFVADILNI